MARRALFAKHDGKMTFNATVREGDENGAPVAHATYKMSAERGELILKDPEKKYEVTHKNRSGRWELRPKTEGQEEAAPLIEAYKPKWFSKTTEFKMGDETFEMSKTSTFRSNFAVVRKASTPAAAAGDKEEEKSGDEVGNVIDFVRTGPRMGSSHNISFEEDIPVELPLFCYWIANLYHKRDASGAAGGNAGAGAV